MARWPRRTYWWGAFAQWPSGLPSGHVVKINGTKNTPLLVFLPSAWWCRLKLARQVRTPGMRRWPEMRAAEERGESAETLLEVEKVVMTMFCSSEASVVENATNQNPYIRDISVERERERERERVPASGGLMMMMGRCCHSTCAMGVACWALLDGLRAIMGCDRHSGRDQFGTVVICLTALLPYLEGWCKNSPLVTGEQWHPSLSHPRQVYTTT